MPASDITNDPSFQPTPPGTLGYGPRETIDDTRQAQQQVANDAPVDVNPNAILAREQGRVVAQMGAEFVDNSARRGKIADDIFHMRAIKSAT